MEATYLAFYVPKSLAENVAYFIAANAAVMLLLWVLSTGAPSSDLHRRSALPLILGFAILFRLTLVPLPPVASDDLYRYLWDGRVWSHGINPYLLAPDHPSLTALWTADLPWKINFPWMRTIYPPLAQVVFAGSHGLFGPSAAGLKLLFVVCDLASILLLVRLLRLLGLPEERVILYAWSPVPVMYFALDGHVDALGIPLLLLFILFSLRQKHGAAAVALGAAGAAKLLPLITAPFSGGTLPVLRRIGLGLVPFLLLLVTVLPFLEGTGGVTESLLVFGTTFYFNGPLFTLLQGIGAGPEAARVVCGVLFLAGFVAALRSGRPLVEKILLAFLAFAVCSPVVQPWYLSWLAALLVLRWSFGVFLMLGLSNLSNLTVLRYRTDGAWREEPLVVLFEFAVPLAIVAAELWGGRMRGDPARA